MPITLIKGPDAPGIDGVDRHYYEKQVPPASPFDDGAHAFKVAAARAKDRARHNQIKAIRKEEQRLLAESVTGLRLTAGLDIVGADFSDQARANVLANRTVDGVRGATDDAIKL